jgi:predicted neutral ceramidase superfamily lipid hydrolase
LAVFGFATAIVLGVMSVRLAPSEPMRGLSRGIAGVSFLFGAAALATVVGDIATLPMLLLLMGGYAVLAGALELVWGLRHRARSALARDAIIVGASTLALAAVLALVADPVSAVGFFGAYAVMLGLFLLIAGLSLKWSEPSQEIVAS